MEVTWEGGTLSSTYNDDHVQLRISLADAAKQYDWPRVLSIMEKHPELVNAWRLDGPSWYAPLHQAASAGASVATITRLIDLGAWRTLQTACGERAVDIASRKGHTHLLEVLAPVYRHRVAPGVLLKIQAHFHAVIRSRAAALVEEQRLRLPELDSLLELETLACGVPCQACTGDSRTGWSEMHATPRS